MNANHNDYFTRSIERVERVVERSLRFEGLQIPHVSEQYSYERGFHDKVMWTAGFWPGILWLMYGYSQREDFGKKATEYRGILEEFLERTGPHSGHDLGFQFLLSAKAEYQFTGSEAARSLALSAAEQLSKRYQTPGQYIRAWGHLDSDEEAGKIIIDCMMNLPLLFWASEETGNPRFADIARFHADSSRQFLLRSDGSFYHTFEFEPSSGKPLRAGTHQGHAKDSTWSRGQAWAIYGFALAHRHTKDSQFLQVSQQAADAYLRLVDGHEWVPPWDFDMPQGSNTVKDTSAASIAAAGLLELSAQLSDHEAEVYRRAAVHTLEALEQNYAANLESGQDGILTQGCYHYPAQKGLIESTCWGDYFYVEALLKLKGHPTIYGM